MGETFLNNCSLAKEIHVHIAPQKSRAILSRWNMVGHVISCVPSPLVNQAKSAYHTLVLPPSIPRPDFMPVAGCLVFQKGISQTTRSKYVITREIVRHRQRVPSLFDAHQKLVVRGREKARCYLDCFTFIPYYLSVSPPLLLTPQQFREECH